MEKKKKETTLSYLPHELSIKILLRLPVKSVIRFKRVCKFWFSLISHDPHFANSHFQLSAVTHTRRIMFMSNYIPKTLSIEFESSFHCDTVAEIPNPILLHRRIENTSSCRGFVFLHCHPNIFVWNPSTGVHRKIPLSLDSNLDVKYFNGFGYDESRDDYLVVSMSYDPFLTDIYSHLKFFSLRDNTWKELEGTHFPYISNSYDHRVGSLFSGAIHWLAFRHDLSKDVIIAFDLMERKLVEMPFPAGFDLEPGSCDLWVFGEFLSLWATDYVKRRVEIWVMKEYKVHSSWTKTLVLPINGKSSKHFFPMCCTTSGDIVGTDGNTRLLKYNDKGKLLDHYTYCSGRLVRSKVTMYTESLLSLPGGNVQA